MATKAYILIETAVGKTREVARALREIEGMQSVEAGDSHRPACFLPGADTILMAAR